MVNAATSVTDRIASAHSLQTGERICSQLDSFLLLKMFTGEKLRDHTGKKLRKGICSQLDNFLLFRMKAGEKLRERFCSQLYSSLLFQN